MLIPCVALSLHLLLSVPATDSIRISFLQTYHTSEDRVWTRWATMMVGDIEALSGHNGSDHIIYRQSWSKEILDDQEWDMLAMLLEDYFNHFQRHIQEISAQARVEGALTTQCWSGCPSSEGDPDGYIFRVAVNGVDVIDFNVTRDEWMARNNPYSQFTWKIMHDDQTTHRSVLNMLKNTCRKVSTGSAAAGKEALSMKIQPKAYIASRPAGHGTEVHCWVTGFYPQPINVSLWTENKMEDGLVSETLPNGDGTYQTTVMASLTEEQNITCRVEHSSFEEPLIVQLERKHHTHATLAVMIAIAAVVMVVGLVVFLKQYKKYRVSARGNRRGQEDVGSL
ncbi:antigen-presenting glycoprotein CD1d-like [Hyperolius riggenbachi]|uniref:antigen-presenting glycoprotein CD1d-like n=1 Tax=Hyperolius riggenbachi TaxID=752182 RepID=UPI0035A32728